MSSITVSKDLRSGFGPPRDQGQRPTCLAFAMSDAHAAARGAWVELSCEYLFHQAKRLEGTPPTRGASTSSVRAAVETNGQPVETDWKYLDALPADLTQWVPPATIGQVFRRSTTLVSGGFDEAWAEVEAGKPVLIVMTISDAFYAPDADGIVDSAESPDPSRRHAVVAAATGERAGVKYLLGRNSWGETWGLQGHAWLTEAYLTPRISLLVTMN